MKKLSLILCIALCLAVVSCAAPRGEGVSSETTQAVSPADSTPMATSGAVSPIETTPEETPEPVTPFETTPEETPEPVTPAETTPEATTPIETTPEATTSTETTPEVTLEETTSETTAEPETEPEGKTSVAIETPEATPVETTSEETTPAETPVIIPPFTEAAEFYHYENLPDAYAEIPADMMAEIEALVDVEIDWENHYLGNHKGYVLFGVLSVADGEIPKYYTRGDLCFGFFTELYGYKDGVITSFKDLYEAKVFGFDERYYIAYMGAKKAIGELPDANKELPEETIQIIKGLSINYERHYYGFYDGYVIFGNGRDYTSTGTSIVVNKAKYNFRDSYYVYIYSPETGVLVIEDAIRNGTIDNIEYENIVRAAMVSTVRYIIKMSDRGVLPES